MKHGFQQYLNPTTASIFFKAKHVDELPAATQPVDARHDRECMWTNNEYTIRSEAPPPPPTYSQLSTQINRPDMAGSDGSVDVVSGDRACAAAIHINGRQHSRALHFPPSSRATSYRSELEGIKEVLNLAEEHKIVQLTQTCDNKAAVNGANTPFTNPTQTLSAEADILMAIHHQRQQSSAKLILKWIKAHQDDNKRKEELPDEAQLNVEMDEQSKDERENGTIQHLQPYPGSGAMLIIDSEWVTSNYYERIQEASLRPQHLQWFLKKYDTHNKKTEADYHNIYWRGIGYACKQLTQEENIRIMKYINGWLNSGRQKGLFDQSPKCPGCGWSEETQLHIFQCNHPRSVATRTIAIQALAKYYDDHKIPSTVYVPFIRMITNACNNVELLNGLTTTPPVTIAAKAQAHLSPDFLLRGLLDKRWLSAICKVEKDKPLVKLTHMYIGLWRILFA